LRQIGDFAHARFRFFASGGPHSPANQGVSWLRLRGRLAAQCHAWLAHQGFPAALRGPGWRRPAPANQWAISTRFSSSILPRESNRIV